MDFYSLKWTFLYKALLKLDFDLYNGLWNYFCPK